MATKKSVGGGVFGGDPSQRMSNVLSGERRGGRLTGRQTSTAYAPGAYNTMKTDVFRAANMRKDKIQNRVPVGTVDLTTYFGDEGTGSRKATPPRKIAGNPFRRDGRGGYVYEGVQLRLKSGEPMSSVDRYLEKVNKRRAATIAATKAAKNQVKTAPAAKKDAPIRTTVDMRTTPARMAVNPRTGSTLGFTTGKTTGSTSFKPGVAAKTRVSPAQQMARNAFNKGGVAGPSRSGGGRSAGPSRSTSAPSRGDVGAGRRGGGR